MCHTSYITQFTPKQEEQCLQQYRKQCHIIIGGSYNNICLTYVFLIMNIFSATDVVQSNSTSKVCLRPLQRICGWGLKSYSTMKKNHGVKSRITFVQEEWEWGCKQGEKVNIWKYWKWFAKYDFCRSAAPPIPGSLLALADEVDTTQASNQVLFLSLSLYLPFKMIYRTLRDVLQDEDFFDSECKMYHETICSGSQALLLIFWIKLFI